MLLLGYTASAQSFNPVTHITGTQVIGGVNVGVNKINDPSNLTYFCGTGPYWIGNSLSASPDNGYEFTFSEPVKMVRFRIAASDTGEKISFQINDTNYYLTSNNISPYYCAIIGNNGNSVATNGVLSFINGGENNTTVTIASVINKVSVKNVVNQNGSVFSFDFVVDTTALIRNFTDDTLCIGDTIHVSYDVTGTYASNNVFSFELSDRFGNFTSPVVLGTQAGMTGNTFKGVIPSSVPSGDAYRVRILSNHPADTSLADTIPITIGHPPVFYAYNSGPGCEGDTVKIGVMSFSHLSDCVWNGPAFIPNLKAQHITLNEAKMSDAGKYVVKVIDYGCVAYDSTTLQMHTNPVKAISINNSPLCEGDTLKLSSHVDSAGAINVWHGLNGKQYIADNVVISNAKVADTGYYILITTFNGCTAKDTTYVVVKPMPVPAMTATEPCEGGELILHSGDSTRKTIFNWTGPNGFSCSVKDTLIRNATLNLSGEYVLAINADGCVAIDTVYALVKPIPAKPDVSTNSPVCEGDNLILSTNNAVSGINYSWAGPAGYNSSKSSGSITKVTLSASGLYYVAADLNGCYSYDTTSVTIKHTPFVPQLSSNSPLKEGQDLHLTLKSVEDGVGYTWKGPLDFSSLLTNADVPKVTKANAGTYVMTAVKEGCTSISSLDVVVADADEPDYVTLYPNPNNGNFSLKGYLNYNGQVKLRIVSATGQTVYNDEVAVVKGKVLINVNLKDNLASGVYTLQLKSDVKDFDLPFVVDRNK
ncbi:MAG: T9SS type A sorting domain-containing protein [Bacteroidetes bacterium]|nr:T9SS type A sorting domain-containing protein [Bacteroidota bacterium]